MIIDLTNLPQHMNLHFLPIYKSDYRYNVLLGGSGSGKSRFLIQLFIIRLLIRKKYKLLALRKFGVTIKNSTFQEFKTTIIDWGFEKHFNFNKSDSSITCLLNGNMVIMTGLDNQEKIKSISGITDIFMEEASEFYQEDFEQLDLRLRGINNYKYQMFLAFNPISDSHWIKHYFFDKKVEDCLINRSTYLNNRFIDSNYVNALERLKETNYKYYQVYCLGEWGQTGRLVYNNWEVKDFNTDYKNFNKIYCGVDWGFNDPLCLLEIGWKDQEIYVTKEFYKEEIITSDFINYLNTTDYKKNRILLFGDSAEKDRIAEVRRAGYNMDPCNKGQNYKIQAIDWVKSHKIYIHPLCREFIREIQNYSYKKYKDQEKYYDEPIEINDHLLDCLIYSTNDLRKDVTGRSKFANIKNK
jgi:phage terminase large subunit